MQPGQIRVFDGLRVTTEHVTHLQSALQSALRDLRAIVGPGIYRGLQVGLVNGSAVIQPGLGIDYEGNRVVRDDPVTLPLETIPKGDSRFVCLKYDRVENGEVEGRATLVWDSSQAVLVPQAPSPRENLLVLARVYPAEDGHLSIEQATTTPEPQPVDHAPATLALAQGVSRVAPPPDAPDQLRALVTGALRRTPVPPQDFSFAIAERELALPFEAVGLSCQVLIDLTVTPASADQQAIRLQARCSGEATLTGQGISQFSLCSLYEPAADSAYGSSYLCDVSEAAVGMLKVAPRFPTQPVSDTASAASPGAGIIAPLGISVTLKPGSSSTRIVVACEGRWDGAGGDTVASALEAAIGSLRLEIVTAWKAQGGLSASNS